MLSRNSLSLPDRCVSIQIITSFTCSTSHFRLSVSRPGTATLHHLGDQDASDWTDLMLFVGSMDPVLLTAGSRGSYSGQTHIYIDVRRSRSGRSADFSYCPRCSDCIPGELLHVHRG